jgi:hypothetical protein
MSGLHPTSELVACAWIASIPDSGFTDSMVATRAPNQESWPVVDGVSQFISVRVVGGTPRPVDIQAPLAMPVVEVMCWATVLNSNKPPWFVANQNAEVIRLACYSRSLGVFGRALTPTAKNVTYNPATVHAAMMHTEPRRIYQDPRSYACYQFDLGMVWKEVNLVISN